MYSTAEFLLPFALDTGTLPTGPPIGPVITAIAALGLRADVRPVEGQINTEVTVLKDAVMVFGTLPVDVTVTATTPVPGVLPLNFRVLLYFQEIVECPGACPTDQVVMSRSVIEKDVNQPLIGPGTTPVINLLIYKAVIRTQVTVTRVGMEGNRKHHHQHHHSQDSNQHCNPRQSDTINSPLRY
ncbi:hypothetical protein [Paracerasibacillus soli]|uniref:Uncharacterized protein n=1 Tax=Paracerasibacillus soli TaxID=480284 RepID=A0ABU5CY48_9BACI|nr:hypothetical protein [Virgibacillus soli]MDY0410348.1 hypothetical protein [Virgibacillus soli]